MAKPIEVKPPIIDPWDVTNPWVDPVMSIKPETHEIPEGFPLRTVSDRAVRILGGLPFRQKERPLTVVTTEPAEPTLPDQSRFDSYYEKPAATDNDAFHIEPRQVINPVEKIDV
jgi:hypothetical protein